MTREECKAYWAKHIWGWRRSGLSQAQYSARYRLKVSSLKYWSCRTREALGDEQGKALTLVPVQRAGLVAVAAHAGSLARCVVRVQGECEVEFAVMPQADYLVDLLKGLR